MKFKLYLHYKSISDLASYDKIWDSSSTYTKNWLMF